MKTYITFSCGHEETVQLYGSVAERDRKAEWMARSCKCSVCKAADREAENAKAAEAAADAGRPALVGSEKQIAWANTIREKMIAELLKYRTDVPGVEDAQGKFDAAMVKFLAASTKAGWWIDNRDCTTDVVRTFAKFFQAEVKAA